MCYNIEWLSINPSLYVFQRVCLPYFEKESTTVMANQGEKKVNMNQSRLFFLVRSNILKKIKNINVKLLSYARLTMYISLDQGSWASSLASSCQDGDPSWRSMTHDSESTWKSRELTRRDQRLMGNHNFITSYLLCRYIYCTPFSFLSHKSTCSAELQFSAKQKVATVLVWCSNHSVMPG